MPLFNRQKLYQTKSKDVKSNYKLVLIWYKSRTNYEEISLVLYSFPTKSGFDAIHDTVHEMAKDEARHGKGFEGLYNRYFKK